MDIALQRKRVDCRRESGIVLDMECGGIKYFLLCFCVFAVCLPGCRKEGTNMAEQNNASKEQSAEKKLRTAIFAGGCFWGVQYVFDQVAGVVETTVGYIGGSTENPTYEQVCTNTTGHAEAVKVVYDPQKISYEKLLEVFFEIHDPTQLNRQGPDVGLQYRSAIFYLDDSQKLAAEKFIKKLTESKKFSKPIVTAVEKAGVFWPAEEYHQKYFEKHPDAGCHVNMPEGLLGAEP